MTGGMLVKPVPGRVRVYVCLYWPIIIKLLYNRWAVRDAKHSL